MRVINRSDGFISLAVEEGETITISNGTNNIRMSFPEECILNCYRKNVSKAIIWDVS